MLGLNINEEKNLNYLEKIHTKAVYGKSSEMSGVAKNIRTPLAAVCVDAVMDWPATSVKEARATRVARASMLSTLSLSRCCCRFTW